MFNLKVNTNMGYPSFSFTYYDSIQRIIKTDDFHISSTFLNFISKIMEITKNVFTNLNERDNRWIRRELKGEYFGK